MHTHTYTHACTLGRTKVRFRSGNTNVSSTRQAQGLDCYSVGCTVVWLRFSGWSARSPWAVHGLLESLERWHAIGSHSVLALRLHLAACIPSSSCRFWVLDHLCSNLFQSFHLCWITKIRFVNFTFSSSAFKNELHLKVPVCYLVVITTAIPLLPVPEYSILAVWEIFNHSDTCAVPSVCNAFGSLILYKLCPVFTFLQQLMTKNCELFTHTLVLQCSASTSSHQHQTTHVYADIRIALLCHALRKCVIHVPSKFCLFSLLVH